MKKLQLFDQNHGLSPLQKSQFCLLFKSMFILSRKACFLTRTSPNTFSGCILRKAKRSKNFKFLTKTFAKMPILWVFESDILLFRKTCLLCKTSKIVFSRCIFRIYDMGIQGVTGGYKGLQGVTGGYKGLQGLTGGDKALQGVTNDYRNFFLSRTFPDTFSWSILHKNQS